MTHVAEYPKLICPVETGDAPKRVLLSNLNLRLGMIADAVAADEAVTKNQLDASNLRISALETGGGVTGAIVVAAGANQAAATQLSKPYNKVTGAGGVKLPLAVVGTKMRTANYTGGVLSIYPSTGQNIEQPAGALAANAAATYAAGKNAEFYCFTNGTWTEILNN